LARVLLAHVSEFDVVAAQLHQSFANGAAALWYLRRHAPLRTHPALAGAGGAPALAAELPVHFYGVSMGAVLGAGYALASPSVSRAALSVGGAPFSMLMTRSANFRAFLAPLSLQISRPSHVRIALSAVQVRSPPLAPHIRPASGCLRQGPVRGYARRAGHAPGGRFRGSGPYWNPPAQKRCARELLGPARAQPPAPLASPPPRLHSPALTALARAARSISSTRLRALGGCRLVDPSTLPPAPATLRCEPPAAPLCLVTPLLPACSTLRRGKASASCCRAPSETPRSARAEREPTLLGAYTGDNDNTSSISDKSSSHCQY